MAYILNMVSQYCWDVRVITGWTGAHTNGSRLCESRSGFCSRAAPPGNLTLGDSVASLAPTCTIGLFCGCHCYNSLGSNPGRAKGSSVVEASELHPLSWGGKLWPELNSEWIWYRFRSEWPSASSYTWLTSSGTHVQMRHSLIHLTRTDSEDIGLSFRPDKCGKRGCVFPTEGVELPEGRITDMQSVYKYLDISHRPMGAMLPTRHNGSSGGGGNSSWQWRSRGRLKSTRGLNRNWNRFWKSPPKLSQWYIGLFRVTVRGNDIANGWNYLAH